MTNKEAIKFLKQLYPNGHCWLDEQRIEAIGMAVKALQEEPVSDIEAYQSRWGKSIGFINEPTSEEIGDYDHKAVMKSLCPQLKEEPTIPDIVDEHFWKMLGEEPVSEDLEKAAHQYYKPNETFMDGFKKGAKWQKEKDEEEKILTYKHGFDYCKEQMMAKAINGTARPDDSEVWCNLASSNLKDGDKVKVIVIKED